MTFFLALFLLFGIAAATWAVGLALYQYLLGGPDLRDHPNFLAQSAVPLVVIAAWSFAPFPYGYFLSLVLWWVMVKLIFELPWPRAVVLFLILAVLSIVSRLIILGVLEITK